MSVFDGRPMKNCLSVELHHAAQQWLRRYFVEANVRCDEGMMVQNELCEVARQESSVFGVYQVYHGTALSEQYSSPGGVPGDQGKLLSHLPLPLKWQPAT